MKTKGFIISLDALLALLLTLVMIGTSVYYLSGTNYDSYNSNYLKEISMDSLTVLEKSGTLEETVKEDSSDELRILLNKLPYQICGELLLFESTDLDNAVIVVSRSDCEKSYLNFASTKRSFVVNDGSVGYYLAEMNTWYR